MFKKKQVKQNTRKRQNDSESESEDETQIVRKEKKIREDPNFQKTTKQTKAAKPQVEDSESDESSCQVGVSYKSRKSSARDGPSDMGATATLEIETETDKDAQAIYEKSLKINAELKGKEDDKVYRGLANYAQYFEKKDTAQGNAASGFVRKGPIRAPANVRSTVRWDYQPDICKDYKETGFCGFGDSCKFLHDRTDYKYGWQLEQEHEDGDNKNYEIPDSDEEDHLPFKCYICRNSFKDPVMTKCKHYFCTKCALEHFKKTPKCYICQKNTFGEFRTAEKIVQKLKDAGDIKTMAKDSDSDSDESD
ncbi:hypothetical protein M8J75_008265 [Diaphorina citri]|nr:hypothetical protein M8J75_008265 [Diaphorina citri]KAI5753406.1 hypothetical protein M8J77_026569 [Diaphorina citri]